MIIINNFKYKMKYNKYSDNKKKGMKYQTKV